MPDERGADTATSPAPDRVLHSDPHDFAGLYMRHRAAFTLHARRYLRDGRDADEVVQEAFLRLFLALPELETELQALAYCRRTITNLCIDRFRAQARRPSLVDLDSARCAELADEDPGDPVVRAEDAALVREALSLLSPLHRAALVKREIEEKPFPVIAAELDIAEDSVKHVLFRARRALRRILVSTSLAPGSDSDVSGPLSKVARAGSGGLAGFLLLFALSLGTGPDLRAIPVVGTDLPELIPVTDMAEAVGHVVTGVAGAVKAAADGGQQVGTTDSPPDAGDPLPAAEPPPPPSAPVPGPVLPVADPTASPSPSPSSSPAAVLAEPSPTGTAAPSPTADVSASTSPSPSASAEQSPSSEGSPSPSGPPTPTPTPSPTSAESYTAPTADPSATADPAAEPTADAGDAGDTDGTDGTDGTTEEPDLSDGGATERALLPPIG